MLTETNIAIIFYSLPIYQLLFYTIQLISFKKSNPSRRHLGLILLTMTAYLTLNAIYNLGYHDIMAWFYYIYIPLLLALPPFHYLYISSLVNKNHQIDRSSRFVLFIPPLLVILLNAFLFGLQPQHTLLTFLNDDHTLPGSSLNAAGAPLLFLWVSLLFLLLLQLFLSVKKIKTILKTESFIIQEHPSHLAHLQLKWVTIISASLIIFIIVSAIQILFIGTGGLTTSIAFNVVILISGGLTGFFGMKQDTLLNEVSGVGPISSVPGYSFNVNDNGRKSSSMALKPTADEETTEIIDRIEKLLQEKKPYLNKRFSIDDLCEQIEVKRNKVTPVINEVLGKNFNGLINDYRVLEAIRLFETDMNHLTIDAIADKVGFHSRSSFYACFKKFTGQTPKEFINLRNNSKTKE